MIFDKFMVILRGFTFIEIYLFTIVSQTKVTDCQYIDA